MGGGLAVLPLPGLRHRHVDALQPLLGVLLVLGLQHVGPAVGEDLEGPGQAALMPLPGHHLQETTSVTFRIQGQPGPGRRRRRSPSRSAPCSARWGHRPARLSVEDRDRKRTITTLFCFLWRYRNL